MDILLTKPETVTIDSCPNIKAFYFTDAHLLQDFSFLNKCPLFDTLEIEGVEKFPSAIPSNILNILKTLIVSNGTKDFSFLKECTKLESLSINQSKLISNSNLDMDFVALLPDTLKVLSIPKQLHPLSEDVIQAFLQKKIILLTY